MSHVHGLWGRLEERFGLVSMRPRLADDVRLRNIGEDWELVQRSTRRVVPLSEEDAELVRSFDGERSIAELIVAGIGAGTLRVEPVLRMIDRLVRAEMLAEYPPDLFRQIEVHLARLAEQAATTAAATAATAAPQRASEPRPDPSAPEWVPATAELGERARFLRGIALLASLDQRGIGALADAAKEEVWPAASEILREGARPERFYIVRTGDVTVNRIESDGAKHRVARLGPGEWFGEAGLLDGTLRAATITAGTARPVQLLSFDADTFATWISPYVTSYRGRELISRRRARLEQVPLFRALAPSDLDSLARALREERVEAGSIVFRQGDLADAFYVIVDGSVGVIKDGAPIAKLTSGEFFGETALLFTQARTATVAATETSTFWVLERSSFTTFVREVLLHRHDMMPTVMGRLGSSEPH